MYLYFLIIPYAILLVFGFKSTWSFAAKSVIDGSSGIVLPIILFILMILIVGPVMGIINLVKLAILKSPKAKIEGKSDRL